MKRPVILEGDTARNFTAKRIYVRPANGGALIPFVPEDEVALTTKSINENGVFQASKDGAYGWSSVTVNVPANTSVTGTGPDGKQHTVTTDPDTGELVDTEVPTYIVIETPPKNPYGIYIDGQTLNKEGMVVKAYFEDGTLWGVVPNGEITLNPSAAEYDESLDVHDAVTAVYEGDPSQFPYPDIVTVPAGTALYVTTADYIYEVTSSDDIYFTLSEITGGDARPGDIHGAAYSLVQNATYSVKWRSVDGESWQTVNENCTNRETTLNGKTFYWGAVMLAFLQHQSRNIELCAVMPHYQTGTILFDGTVSPTPAGSRQTVTVGWSRIGDGAVLEDTFEILVAPPYGGHGED